MSTIEKLTTMIINEYNKNSNLFEDHPIEIIENDNSITITKVLLKNKSNKNVLLFASWRDFRNDLYFDESDTVEVYSISYTWEGTSYQSIYDIAKAMKDDYIANQKIINLFF
jgi:hypothetical protein